MDELNSIFLLLLGLTCNSFICIYWQALVNRLTGCQWRKALKKQRKGNRQNEEGLKLSFGWIHIDFSFAELKVYIHFQFKTSESFYESFVHTSWINLAIHDLILLPVRNQWCLSYTSRGVARVKVEQALCFKFLFLITCLLTNTKRCLRREPTFR